MFSHEHRGKNPNQITKRLDLAVCKRVIHRYKVGLILGVRSWFMFGNNPCKPPCS